LAAIKEGSRGKEVKELQVYLGLTPDGFFGPATKAAVVVYQTARGLTADGIVGPATWLVLNMPATWLRDNVRLQDTSLGFGPGVTSTANTAVINSIANYGLLAHEIAPLLGIKQAAIHAIIAVESAGSGMEDKRMKIRFETHIFWRKWGKNNPDIFHEFFSFDKEKPWLNQTYREAPFHGRQDLEQYVLKHALQLNESAAYESISMGLGQLMGFHWEQLGFKSAKDFYYNQLNSERNQALALFDFIRSDTKMLTALQE